MNRVAGAVLAGGASRRFGRDKRFFPVGGKTLLEIACAKIRALFPRSLIVGDLEGWEGCEGFEVIPDRIKGQGPLGGIYSALLVLEEEGCLFIPVDMPYLPRALLKYLGSFGDCEVCYPVYSRRLYPLPGYYSRALLPRIERRLQKGERSLMGLLAEVQRRREVGEEELKGFGDPAVFLANLNRPSDLEALSRREEEPGTRG